MKTGHVDVHQRPFSLLLQLIWVWSGSVQVNGLQQGGGGIVQIFFA